MENQSPINNREQIIKALGQKIKDLLSDLDAASKKLKFEEEKNE